MSLDLSDPRTIEAIGGWLAAAGVDAIEITHGAQSLRLGGIAAAAPAPAAQAPLTAPLAGRLLHAHPMRAKAAKVVAGEAAAFVAIGPMLLAVPAPGPGRVAGFRAPDGATVGFADPVVVLEGRA